MPSYDAAVARSLPVGDPVPIGDISEAIVTRVRGGLDAARAVPSAVATARVPVEPPAPAATGMAPDAGPTPAPRPRVVVEPAAQEARARSADKTLPVPVVSPLAAPEPEPEFAAQGTASWGTPRESRLSDGRYSEVLHGEPLRQTPTPSNVRASFTNEDYAEPRFSSLAPPRRAGAARWIVGFVLSGIVVLGALTVGKKLFVTAGAQQADPSSDARVARLLQDGEKAFSEGDLEGAQEQFDRASAFADKDPKVAAALARLAVVRADVTWLKTKLLAADDPDLPGARKMLAADAARARKAADRAAELAPKDATSVRTRIDALREAGDTAAARKLVPDVAGVMSQPETGTTLAALDLAEEKVDWPTVIGRLRTAVDADGNLGRARALLVYALARSGDAAAAKAELDRLQALPRPHPLMQALRAYVARAGQSVDLSQLPEVGTEVPADWHEALKLAAAAKQKGDTRRVEALLAAAVDKSHGDPEALTAQADEKWETGDKDGALALYKKVAAKAPAASAWARHAKERLEAKSTKERSSPLEEAMPAEHRARREREREHQPEPEPEPEPPTPPPTPAPGGTIDTSDLPGVKAPPPAAPEATQAPAKQQPPAAPPAQTPSTPPGVDTSDLPGYK
ncbi:MAG TPA: hypothetical protein VHB21_18020 [Minicystis sp.]|nr:hypothetical protein [Minicystis sp.]